ncbi:hypothetical protein ROLI_000670 [Roseobacter fucihabitans]|uniref:Flagellar protein FlgJ N-terminal domain-containing protein n=1 Tax=Roseobacter fucihabitans TaxID=1537242 RepID=A0ABZ2BLI5_9RHOB|nr:rod-binding protein [Roseobacter litoralis]MBC6966474.1 chemotactic signal-response protein CheL [Roseobacter litoralis]
MSVIQSVNGSVIPTQKDQALREVAQKLEASFLAEMLKSAGLGKTSDHFGGGAGEEQFGSFLLQEQAMQMVKAGGIGLSESLFQALKEKQNDA